MPDQYGDYPLFANEAHALVGGIIWGAARNGELRLHPVQDGDGNYTPDYLVSIAGFIGVDQGVTLRLMPLNKNQVPPVLQDPDGMELTAERAAHAVLCLVHGEPGAMRPGGYVTSLVLAAMHAHPLELRGVFSRAYPTLANAVDLYKNVEGGLAILRERAGLAPEEEKDAHAPEDD